MAIFNYLKNLIRGGRSPKPKLEYVQEARGQAPPVEINSVLPSGTGDMDNEIDLSTQTDLEDYARGLSISKESIERWISSGLLMPEELKVAEKLVKIMRKH
jgi:hypothetical protein